MLVYSFLAIAAVSAISLIGAFFLSVSTNRLERVLFFLVSFAAGALLGDTVFHLLPEIAAGNGFTLPVSISIITGILIFFIVEKFFHWQHCHEPACLEHHDSRRHALAATNLIGDGIHNFIDGLVIAGSFAAGPILGISTTLAVILHEIPQEIGDFAVLIHSGLSRRRALSLNILSACTAFLGGGLFFIFPNAAATTTVIIPLTAGGFLYIALSDLIPELHHERRPFHSTLQLLGLIVGLTVMASLLLVE